MDLEELAEVRNELVGDVARLRGEITMAESELADLLRDGGDGAGDDQADAGSKTFEREHEMSLANNTRDMLAQAEHAPAAHRRRHLRHLRELWQSDRQGAPPGLPPCHAVRDMQAARGASLNDARPRPAPATLRRRRLSVLLGVAVLVLAWIR